MTPKERTMAAFDHRPTDRVPVFHAGFSSRAASYVLGREAYVGGGIQQWREARALWDGPDAHAEYLSRSRQDAFDLTRVLDQDLVRTAYWRMAERPSKKIDERTYLYGDPGGTYRVMQADPDTELYQIIDASTGPEPTMEDLEREVEKAEEALAAAKNSPPGAQGHETERAAMEVFPDRAVRGGGTSLNIDYRRPIWLEAVALRPDLVARSFDAQVERSLRSIPAQKAIGLRLLAGGGDFASNKGPFYSPKFFHEVTLPRWKRIVDECHRHECYCLFASDGDLWLVADDLFGATGMDGFFEIDGRAGMDLRGLRARFPHLTLMGGISSHTLHTGTPEQVEAETLDAIQAARDCGSILVGCSNQVVSQTPPENLLAMVRTLEENR